MSESDVCKVDPRAVRVKTYQQTLLNAGTTSSVCLPHVLVRKNTDNTIPNKTMLGEIVRLIVLQSC